MSKEGLFGTDGIRGKAGEASLSAPMLLQIAQAIKLSFNDVEKMVIGGDTRVSTPAIMHMLAGAFSHLGVSVDLIGTASTPCVAYLTKMGYDIGISVSASHNPYEDNGIKLFDNLGEKVCAEKEANIESFLHTPFKPAEKFGAVRSIPAQIHYQQYLLSQFPLNLSGQIIVVDSANGAMVNVAASIFESLGAHVHTIAEWPNGKNINAGCGATNTDALVQAVKTHNATIGVAFDGDGDRAMLVTRNGIVVDGDSQLYILAKYTHPEGLVGTQMTNQALALYLDSKKIPFVRTQVGDKYVNMELKKQGWSIGGETSGHLIDRTILTTGDGLIACLKILKVMLQEKSSLAELLEGYVPFTQHMINVKTTDKTKLIEAASEPIQQLSTQFPSARIVLRASGTEALVRLLIEAQDENQAKTIADKAWAIFNTTNVLVA